MMGRRFLSGWVSPVLYTVFHKQYMQPKVVLQVCNGTFGYKTVPPALINEGDAALLLMKETQKFACYAVIENTVGT